MRVEIHNLHFAYAEHKTSPGKLALAGVDLVVEEGTVHAVVGPNGCGKSTLLRVIAGLGVPGSGSIDFVGEQQHEKAAAFVFQDPTLIPWWSVERNVATSAEFGLKPKPLYHRVRDFHTKQVGLEEVRDRRPGTLSRGQQTKVGLGRAFAHDADVLLLDEPFVHLDALTRRRLQEELETHWQLEPRTAIFVTHHVDEAVMLADHISIMSRAPGRILETVTVDAERPRSSLPPSHPGVLSATARVWEALERAARGG